MDNSQTKVDQVTWRATIKRSAQEAALAESQTYWGENDVVFDYRWEHVQAVVRLAIRLATLTGADQEIVEAAAWLHDVAKPHSKKHGQDGAVIARRVLQQTDFPPEKIEAVADAIVKHVGLFTNELIEPVEAAVVWDADKLSKLGATAVIHFLGYKLMMGERTTTRWLEQLSDVSWMERTVRSFHTAPARATGRKRLGTYRALWQQALREFDGDDLFDLPRNGLLKKAQNPAPAVSRKMKNAKGVLGAIE